MTYSFARTVLFALFGGLISLVVAKYAHGEEVTFEFDYAPEAGVQVDQAELRFVEFGKTSPVTLTHVGGFTTSTDPNWRQITADIPPGVYTISVRVLNSQGGLPGEWYVHPTPISTIKPSAPGSIRLKVTVEVQVGDADPAVRPNSTVRVVAR